MLLNEENTESIGRLVFSENSKPLMVLTLFTNMKLLLLLLTAKVGIYLGLLLVFLFVVLASQRRL